MFRCSIRFNIRLANWWCSEENAPRQHESILLLIIIIILQAAVLRTQCSIYDDNIIMEDLIRFTSIIIKSNGAIHCDIIVSVQAQNNIIKTLFFFFLLTKPTIEGNTISQLLYGNEIRNDHLKYSIRHVQKSWI